MADNLAHWRRMEPDMVYIDARLTQWAAWAKQGISLGYPSQSVYSRDRMIGRPPPTAEMPQDVWQVEKAILALKDIERQVLVTYYVNWEPRNVMAKRRNMSVNRFSKLLHRARCQVRDILV